MPDFPITPEAFPASTRTAAGEVDGVHTDVMVVRFADKIMVTITQGGRLAHWVHVPLDNPTADAFSNAAPPTSFEDDEPGPNNDLLPMAHLTATTVLGGTIPERDTAGQLVAAQVASTIATKDSEEKRLVVVGMGLEKKDMSREAFVDLVGLVMGCL
ncbi:Proteasome assembly chaperone 3 protein [Lasiodiplodia theobromae]|uniref:Proteasome assembly chaperone 3 protein n=1 Tax=Lasiodiplodia theobromae TaxID=45133 RepID=UPI0015C3E4DC|nr:Proteasome assembly chaperone 3 protein [Lasiodiplodia theobromae]KAF4536088.1 Proteasome assembly chaperone 3 protein [Lasiodiplodia theobromae]